MERSSYFDRHIYSRLLSERTKERSEVVIIYIAIAGFLLHLSLIALVDLDLLTISDPSKLLTNPIAAVYTPFTFILIYEVYLLVYYLPYSMTNYIGKQYEIIMLILIRRLFKDLAGLELSEDWFQIQDDLQFTYDIVAAVLLFFLILLFNRLNWRRKAIGADTEKKAHAKPILQFIRIKKYLAAFLVPLLVGLALFSLYRWLMTTFFAVNGPGDTFKDINSIFFDEFFTLLILVDVLLLLFSFLHTDQFHKVIRNSGFIVSTILIRLSFSVEGLLNTILITAAVVFGLVILWIHNQYEKVIVSEEVPVKDEEVEL